MKKVAFYTLGCKLNFSETSTIARSFEDAGYIKVDFDKEAADVYVVNTCSVTENADKKCKKIVRDIRRISPDSFVAIIGCFAQLKPKEISLIPGVDAVLGANQKFRILELLDEFEKKPDQVVFTSEIEEVTQFNSSYSINDRTRTFLKVQDGCDYSCTFCTIPLARGKSRSDTIENVVAQARKIGQSGIKEVVLTGVNTGDFGIINGKRESHFIDLIKALDKVEEVERFRISSIEPNLLNEEIIDFVKNSKRFMPHFHIPLQSGSDNLLKKMKRRYLTKLYTSRIEYIRQQMPEAGIGVDVIVGFPGETEEEFTTTYNYLNNLDVSYLHVFTYSERDNTEAVSMEGVVDMGERHKRSKMLRILSEKKRRAFYEEHIGSSRNVLFEKVEEDGSIEGFTDNYIRVVDDSANVSPNSIESCTLDSFNEKGLVLSKVSELVG